MKTAAGFVMAMALVLPACSGASDPQDERPSSSAAVDSGSPQDGTSAALAWEALMGPDGEYAAAAAYSAVIDAFGEVEPYVTIKAAEERHATALVRQLERAGVQVPPNPYLDEVTAPADLASAARAWAEGEITNVAMYDRLLAASTSDPVLTRVLTNLRRASLEQHLPMFRAAADNGGTLTATQMLDHTGSQ